MTAKMGKSLQALVQDFFLQHLAIERNASMNTVAAYRDAMKLFLRYASRTRGCSPDQLDHTVLEANTVRSFLDWLQQERGSRPRTRNHRLAALKAFARYVAGVAPEHLERCRLIRELPPARFEQREVKYLNEDEVVKLIAAIDASSPTGRRDRALLLLLYNTGARVQEIVGLDIDDIHNETIPFVRLLGKGRKQRTCPLWTRTLDAVQRMLSDRNGDSSHPLFLNARGQRLSRSGVAYLLRRAQAAADLKPRHVGQLSPHVIRHTTAMHLLQSGVDITTIAAWLGHSQLSTTHSYIEIDLRMKQAAIATVSAFPELNEVQYPAPHVIDWLEKLTPRCYVQPPAPSPRPASRDRPSLGITSGCG